jgi:hypothetical protein
MPERRFPPPWSVEETICFVVKDRDGQALAYIYFEDKRGAFIKAQTSAATHPKKVQPSKRFNTQMALELSCRRHTATMLGKK